MSLTVTQVCDDFILGDLKKKTKDKKPNLQASKAGMKWHPSTEAVTRWGHSWPGALFCLKDFEIYFLSKQKQSAFN